MRSRGRIPFPELAQRSEHLRIWAAAHERKGHTLLLIAEVIESTSHLRDLRASLGADDSLLVAVDAEIETLRRRIVAREPPGWTELQWLLDQTPGLQEALAKIDGIHAVFDSDTLTVNEIVERIRSTRPDKLMASPRDGS
jgi:hypothetical protein